MSSATINRFFSLHFTLPFILAALVAGHLYYLHVNGSSNPIGTTSNADRTAFHPYFSFKLRQNKCICMCHGNTPELSICFESPNLSNMGNHLLNIACLEKVIVLEKLLFRQLSENDNMVKTILFQIYYPVSSSEAKSLSRIERLYDGNLWGLKAKINGSDVLRCVNNIIKDKSRLPKLSTLCIYTILGGLKEDNSHAYRGSVVAAHRVKDEYGLIKVKRKRRDPATLVSRWYSTGTRRTANVLKKLDSLRERSINYPNLKIDRELYRDFMLDPGLYLLAYQKLRSKPGSMTPGISPTTLDGMSMEEIYKIIELLRTEEFQFTPGRRIHIAKSSGKTRPITIGNPRDKLVQEGMRLILEAIYEPLFLPCSHGFRPKRSCHTALREIFTKFVGCTWWIEGDIESCFDSINHKKLIQILSDKMLDQRFIQLIRKSLNAGYFEFTIHKTNFIGTPQGNIISPILANIYLHELDKFVMTIKKSFDSNERRDRKSSEYNNASYALRKAKKANADQKTIKSLIKSLQKTQAKKLDESTQRLMYIRYADDWIVAVNGSYTQTRNILNKLKDFCNTLNFSLSTTKTKITNSYKDYILFLGTRIKHSGVTTWSKHIKGYRQRNRKALLLTAPLNKIRKKLSETGFVKNNRGITRVTWLPLTKRQIIYNYNSIIRGYSNYYSFITNRGKVMSWLFYVLRDSAARTLSHKLSLGRRAKVYAKFGMMLTIKYRKENKSNSKPKIIQLFKPSLKIEAWNFLIDKVNHDIAQFYANTKSLANLDNLKCSICYSNYRVEMHHIRMMKNLSPKTKSLDALMARANRKQMPLCRSCHMKYHAGDIILTSTVPFNEEIDKNSSDDFLK